MKYTPLHTHSDASLDGAGTVQSLVAEASRLELEHLALTDHGTLANAVAFWSACKDAEIKPILGIESYLLYEGKRHHITLLALNETGLNNLIDLDTHSHTHMFTGGYPLMTLEGIEEKQEGLHILTGCASSALYAGEYEDGERYLGYLVDMFGKDRVSLEVMFVGTHDTFSRPHAMQPRFGLRHVVTNDTHYPCRHQGAAHRAITAARRGFTYDSEHLWLKSRAEITAEGTKYADEAWVNLGLNRTLAIGDMAEEWDMRSAQTLPPIPDAALHLGNALKAALAKDVALKGQAKVRKDRLLYEWGHLKTKGFLDYIYILWDIVSWAKEPGRNIHVGPGRGSGGGSYVLYLLGITSIDPIEYGLLFERFINPSRADYPDVDVDFEADRRQEVMNYAHNRWNTIPIATYSAYSHKSAVHDIARVLKIPKDMELPAAEGAVDSPAFETFINEHPDALETYNTMLGQIRHRGKHAAGVIITHRPVPVERSGDELVAAWAEGMNTKDLSKVGIVKYDILGLTALSQLRVMGELSGSSFDSTYSDPLVFDLFCQGDVAGVFQWSGSEGIRDLTMRIAPRNFYDLTTCNALYRPGALDAGTAEHYPEFMAKPRLLHPRIDPILEKTYGVICYQEQVMAIVAEVMGGDLSQADLARRLISKADVGNPKWEADVDALQLDMYLKGRKEGFHPDLLEKLWHEIYTHSRYSYNLSHASAYTMISYQMAWYKVYHRSAFTVAVLQYDRANAQTYILDAVSHGLKVEMPNVNYSTSQYALHGNTIYIPLHDISWLGEAGVNAILEERARGGLFSSYEEFDKRIPKKLCNARAKKYMETIGAFKGLAGNPASIIKDYAELALPTPYQAQLECLGYIVPTPALYAKIEKIAAAPAKKGYLRYAGFISLINKKKSIHGPYTVYHLSPSGSFWIRGETNKHLTIGTFVSGTKSKFGHSNDCKRYRLGGSE